MEYFNRHSSKVASLASVNWLEAEEYRCRMLQGAVLIQCCGCCPVVTGLNSMLCYTQCTHSPASSKQWLGKASGVCLYPYPLQVCNYTHEVDDLLAMGFKYLCLLKERCESHHKPKNFIESSTGRMVFPILTVVGLWTLDQGVVKCMTLHLWAAN